MKRFFSISLSICLIIACTVPAFASNKTSSDPIRISRDAVEKIHSAAAMSEAESVRAVNLISEKTALEAALSQRTLQTNSSLTSSISAAVQSIDSELESLGAVPLTVADIYDLHGLSYPGATDVPDDTNYVLFYGINTDIDGYDVYYIVARSSGFSMATYDVPFYTEGNAVIYDTDKYVENDFREYIDLATSVASTLFEETFENIPVLEYVGDIWDLSTYFNPTAQQKFSIDYTCGQTYIYSYVADKSEGYYTFQLTAERKQGNCTFMFEQYIAGDFVSPPYSPTYNFAVCTDRWADYDYAVELYKDGYMQEAHYVGDIEFTIDGREVDSFSMPYYNSIWSIPGV